jgi:voltage-gated potassium channel
MTQSGGVRKRVYELVENPHGTKAGNLYASFMMCAIVASLVPLAFKVTHTHLRVLELATGVIFIVDYVMRLVSADFKLKKGKVSFVRYPFTFMAIIDLISIITSFSSMLPALRMLKTLRIFSILRALKAFRYSKNIEIIADVINEQKSALITVGSLAIAYVLISALIIFNVEPQTFNTYFDAVYWATVSLTTVGYGDLYAVSLAGKIITMISAFAGVAIIALPSGIITAGYMERINRKE